jgi:glycosyltransferase involved in cell wall biosynthesis
VKLLSDVPHHRLEEMLTAHHLFCLPTQGENFGHAIFEALAAGRPVLISDQTPWRSLAKRKAGWDIPLSDSTGFVNAIETVAAMDLRELNEWCKEAWRYCNDYIQQSDIKEQYRKLFN